MNSFTMHIDGQGVPGDRTFPVINPATGETFAEAPDCTFAHVAATQAVRIIFSLISVGKRCTTLCQCAQVFG